MEAKIRYLKPEEKEKARALWSQAFFEDSEEFDQILFYRKDKREPDFSKGRSWNHYFYGSFKPIPNSYAGTLPSD